MVYYIHCMKIYIFALPSRNFEIANNTAELLFKKKFDRADIASEL